MGKCFIKKLWESKRKLVLLERLIDMIDGGESPDNGVIVLSSRFEGARHGVVHKIFCDIGSIRSFYIFVELPRRNSDSRIRAGCVKFVVHDSIKVSVGCVLRLEDVSVYCT